MWKTWQGCEYQCESLGAILEADYHSPPSVPNDGSTKYTLSLQPSPTPCLNIILLALVQSLKSVIYIRPSYNFLGTVLLESFFTV